MKIFKKNLICLLLGSLVLFPIIGLAQEQNVNPGINQYYMNPDFQRWQSIFEGQGREVYDQRLSILSELNLKAGQSIADIGAGTGLFSLLFAQQVGADGEVYAVDISEEFIKNISRRAKEKHLNNIQGVVNSAKTVNLPKQSIDMAFICDTYHHFEYPLTTMQSIHQALRADGIVVVIDFRRQPDLSSSWVMGHVRANKDSVIQEIESQGFKLLEDKALLETNYFLRFKKF